MKSIKIANETWLLTVNDRRTHLFENYWPLPNGVAYNAYLIRDEKNVLIDTVEICYCQEFMDELDNLLEGTSLDYLIVNHMEPDHSGSIGLILQKYPQCTIVGNRKTFPILEGFFGKVTNQRIVDDKDVLETRNHRLEFNTIPMVHWPETMTVFDHNTEVLFSSDAFGSFGTLDGGVFDDEINLEFYENELRRYYSNIVGKYGQQVQKALAKLSGLNIKVLAPSHGPVWHNNLSYLLGKYDLWSKYQAEEKGAVIVYGSMYGNTEKMADVIARELAINGVKNIRIYDSSKTHASFIISDIWRFNGLVLGSCAYNGTIFTPMGDLIAKLESIGIKNRHVSLFGSSSWGGGGLRMLEKWAENMKFEIIGPKPEARCAPSNTNLNECKEIARELAKVILG